VSEKAELEARLERLEAENKRLRDDNWRLVEENAKLTRLFNEAQQSLVTSITG
jgi:predicted nuclease with TOPRIM domain